MALRWYECALADTCALARLEPCSEYAHNQTRAMRMSKMTCEVYLSTYFKQHALRSGSFLNFCQPHPGPHVSLWKFFPSTVWTSWILSKILITFYSRPHSNNHLYDFLSTRPDLCVWTLLHHVFLWNRECFFLGHTELNSRFIVMTINEVTFDWPEVFPGFGVICCFCGLRLSPIRLVKFFTENLSLFGLFQSWSGFSEFVISSWQFCCAICYREYEFISFLCYPFFFRVDSSKINFWLVQSSKSAIRISPFPILPRSAQKQERFQVILSCQIDEVLIKPRVEFNQCSKKNHGPLNGSSNRLSCWFFPSAKRSWTLRSSQQHYRISPPSFTQSWL